MRIIDQALVIKLTKDNYPHISHPWKYHTEQEVLQMKILLHGMGHSTE